MKSKELGSLLKSHRESKRFSMREVARKSPSGTLSLSYISRLENGTAEVRPQALHALSQLYDTSYEEYLTVAGIINKDGDGKVSLLVGVDMSVEEERELLRYLQFIRDKNE